MINPLSFALPTKILIALAMVAGYTLFVGIKVHNWTQEKYEKNQLTEAILLVTKTNTIVKNDTSILTRSLERQRKEIEAANQYELDYWKWKAANPVATDPKYDIGADGMRLWNSENTGAIEAVEVR